jgi:hypothetical protein
MWADNETDGDLLGFEIHANLVLSTVNNSTVPPVTVGLFGKKGGGKFNILKLLKRGLASPDIGDPEPLGIYFGTWVFEGYEDQKTAILAVQRSQHSIVADDFDEKRDTRTGSTKKPRSEWKGLSNTLSSPESC